MKCIRSNARFLDITINVKSILKISAIHIIILPIISKIFCLNASELNAS